MYKSVESSSWRKRSPLGFTLVELIVVITILVILGTIAFMNLGGFIGSARDSGRISDVAAISTGLETLIAKGGALPMPENGTNSGIISVMASGKTIGYQWSIGDTILSLIKVSGEGKDPIDKKSYTYAVNSNLTKYQLLGLLESPDPAALMSSFPSPIGTAYAGYETRTPFVRWSSLGVLLRNTGSVLNQPVQEAYDGFTLTGVELYTATGGEYKAYVSNKAILSGTGPVLWELSGRLDATVGTFPGCDTPNIQLPNGQIWATCNVGATVASAQSAMIDTDWSILTPTEVSTIGQYFQWGRNDILQIDYNSGANYSTGTQYAPANNLNHLLFVRDSSNGSWMTIKDYNLWWWSGSDSTTGTYVSLGSPSTMQWPCPSGYHIGTQKEWNDAGLAIVWAKNTLSVGSGAIVSSVLKLSYGGRRYFSAPASFDDAYSIYWQSTADAGGFVDTAYKKSTGELLLSDTSNAANGGMIRCLKN